MPTLYVENVPKEVYEALQSRAKANRTSIAKEVISLLEENVSTKATLAHRKAIAKKLDALQKRHSPGPGPFPSTEEMLREDRSR
jgi:plasmid stability protein